MTEKISSPEAQDQFAARAETVVYNDDNSALIFRQPGEVVAWGGHKWVDQPSSRSANTMLIQTKSGNSYAIGEGIILNRRTDKALNVPAGLELPDVTLGEKWIIPGIMNTSDVEFVAAEYKSGAEPDVFVDRPSPFGDIKHALLLKRQEFIEQHGLK